jgi:hypothetical protein
MAVLAVNLTLTWFEDQTPYNNFDTAGILDLARQFAALRVAVPTEAGRRLAPMLMMLRLVYRERQVEELRGQLHFMRLEGLGYLAQLRAVIMTYRPGPMVATPLPFPGASFRFGEGRYPDMELTDEVLIDDLGLSMDERDEVFHTY